jgi:hypothetical protein
MAYLAQPEQQQQLEWLDGGTLAMLLNGKATDGQLMIGRFDVSEGEAPPFHKHTREDEVGRDHLLAQNHSARISHYVKKGGSAHDQHASGY